MFKKLDVLLLRSFIGPFLAAIFIFSIILILQFFWKYLDDMAGKGLSVWVIFKLTTYLAATVVPLSLPVAILFASLFTFGGLGERFELIAIKASGISFFRFLRPIILLAVFLSLVAFWFANNVVPYSNGRFLGILNEIIYQKPAFDLKPGVFYTKIEGYTIYIHHKTQNGKVLNDLLILENPKHSSDKFRNIISAEEGTLQLIQDKTQKRWLVFTLYRGAIYQERPNTNGENDFSVSRFDKFEKALDMSTFQLLDDNATRKNYQTMNIRELDSSLSAEQAFKPFTPQKNQLFLESVSPIFTHLDKDTLTDTSGFGQLTQKVQTKDSAAKAAFLTTKLQNILASYTTYDTQVSQWTKHNNRYKIEWHKKFTLSLSCFIFFLIGSSLGAIIRKGGLGLPLVIAVGFFVFYFFLSASFEKSVKVGDTDPFVGMWFSSFVLLPLGVYLSYKALNDSQLFNKEFYEQMGKKILRYLRLFQKTSSD